MNYLISPYPPSPLIIWVFDVEFFFKSHAKIYNYITLLFLGFLIG